MNIKGGLGLVSEGNEKHIIGYWRKGNNFYKVSKYLAKLYSSILWKIEIVSDTLGYLVEISKERLEGLDWFLLAA